nr:MAG TPA: hypothetical protein [Caudoviricetes sp.]DAI18766.1 MAG TPA: hypothetical protein [Caudoviricetes sp.]
MFSLIRVILLLFAQCGISKDCLYADHLMECKYR